MPRASRYIIPGQTYHVTQRCHNRVFLLKFAKDRDRYIEMLNERLSTYSVALFNFCITSNHVHLLIKDTRSGVPSNIPAFMNSLAGDFAQYYNLRKQRSGSFWGDRYHATMVDGGEHLFRCLRYIDLNMVRAGVVQHPEHWAWTGYHELVGKRKRYGMLDHKRLLACLQQTDLKGFVDNYEAAIDQALQSKELMRETMWTQNIAVGSQPYVEMLAPKVRNRMMVKRLPASTGDDMADTWCVREPSH